MSSESGRIIALEQQVRELLDRVAQLESQTPIITDKPWHVEMLYDCGKCGQWHKEHNGEVGDCFCDCHKVMCHSSCEDSKDW